jgi:hypothetical protein
MANLEPATVADRETVAALTKIISALSEQLVTQYAFVEANDAEIKYVSQGCAPVGASNNHTPYIQFYQKVIQLLLVPQLHQVRMGRVSVRCATTSWVDTRGAATYVDKVGMLR